MPLIEIVADDKRFFVSTKTLNNDPSFIITQLVNGKIPETKCDCVDVINPYTYCIDIDPKVLENIVGELRGVSKPSYSDDIRKVLFVNHTQTLESKKIDDTSNNTIDNQIESHQNNQVDQVNNNKDIEKINTPDIQNKNVEQLNDNSIVGGANANVNVNVNANNDSTPIQPEKPSIFRKQQQHEVNRSYVDFSASERDTAHSINNPNRFQIWGGGKSTSGNSSIGGFSSSTQNDGNTNTNRSDSEYSKFSSSAMYKESSREVPDSFLKFQAPKKSNQMIVVNKNKDANSDAPKGHHIYKPRKIEFNTAN